MTEVSTDRLEIKATAPGDIGGMFAEFMGAFGTVEGPFQIVALEFSADHAGEVTFEIALESAGEMGFGAM